MSAVRTPTAQPQWARGDPGELMCPYALGPMVGAGPRTLSSSWPGCFISTLLLLALAYLCLCSPHTGSQPDILYPCFRVCHVACKEAACCYYCTGQFICTLPWKLETCTALCELHTASLLKLSVFNSELSVRQLRLSVTSSCTWWPSPSTLQIIMSVLKVIRDPCRCLTALNMHTSSRTVTATSVK